MADYQALRNHNVRFLATAQQLSERQRIVLSDRDSELLVELHRHGFLTALVCFPPPAGNHALHSSACYERPREWWLWRYVGRIQRPGSPMIGGSRPLLLALGPRGVLVVAAQLGEGAAVVRRWLDHLWNTARKTVVRERWRGLLTFAALQPARFAVHDWLVLTGERAWLQHGNAYAWAADEFVAASAEFDVTAGNYPRIGNDAA